MLDSCLIQGKIRKSGTVGTSIGFNTPEFKVMCRAFAEIPIVCYAGSLAFRESRTGRRRFGRTSVEVIGLDTAAPNAAIEPCCRWFLRLKCCDGSADVRLVRMRVAFRSSAHSASRRHRDAL
jgi:hypothetical protein